MCIKLKKNLEKNEKPKEKKKKCKAIYFFANGCCACARFATDIKITFVSANYIYERKRI